jgi:hypothetical protein
MRGTLHLMSAKDYASFRAALQPGLTAGTQAILRGRLADLDTDALGAEARRFFAAAPRTFEAYRDDLAKRRARPDHRALAYVVRTHLPLVQAPTDAAWGWPAATEVVMI